VPQATAASRAVPLRGVRNGLPWPDFPFHFYFRSESGLVIPERREGANPESVSRHTNTDSGVRSAADPGITTIQATIELETESHNGVSEARLSDVP